MRKLFALCLVTAACGSSDSKHPDANAPNDGSTDGTTAGSDAPPTAKQGVVTVTQGDNGTGNTGQAGGGFLTGANVMGPIVATDGPCTEYGATPAATLDAGSISISGTLSPITLTASSGSSLSYHPTATVPYPIFSAGATITFAGSGGTGFPAFSGTVTAPADIAGFTKPTTLSRAGYTARWTAGSGPMLWVLLAGVDGSFNGTTVVCVVPDTGSFAIPASTFALLPAGDTMGGLAVARVAEGAVDVAGGHVQLEAVSEGSTSLVPLTQ